MPIILLFMVICTLIIALSSRHHGMLQTEHPVEFSYFKTQKSDYFHYQVSKTFRISAASFALVVTYFYLVESTNFVAEKWFLLLTSFSLMFVSASYLIFEHYFQMTTRLFKSLSNEAATTARWMLRGFFVLTSVVISFFSESFTSELVVHMTGYSTQNFGGLVYMQLVISVLLVLGITPLIAVVITLHGIISESKDEPLSAVSSFKEKIRKFKKSSLTTAGTALYISAISILIGSSQFIDSMFRSMFVLANFHSPNFECTKPNKEVFKPTEAAHLTRNILDENNLLIARKVNGHWEFEGIQCDPIKKEKPQSFGD